MCIVIYSISEDANGVVPYQQQQPRYFKATVSLDDVDFEEEYKKIVDRCIKNRTNVVVHESTKVLVVLTEIGFLRRTNDLFRSWSVIALTRKGQYKEKDVGWKRAIPPWKR
jgi:hypothetical protein